MNYFLFVYKKGKDLIKLFDFLVRMCWPINALLNSNKKIYLKEVNVSIIEVRIIKV